MVTLDAAHLSNVEQPAPFTAPSKRFLSPENGQPACMTTSAAPAARRCGGRFSATPTSIGRRPTPTPISAEFQDFITRYVWGEIWTRDGLDQRTRRVLVIGTMIALGRWEEFALHVRAPSAQGGFTRDDLKEIVLQQAVYCGVPAGHRALAVITAALATDRA